MLLLSTANQSAGGYGGSPTTVRSISVPSSSTFTDLLLHRHFWNANEVSTKVIAKLFKNSRDEILKSKEDYCWHTWAAIGAVYFPDHDPTNTNQPTYLIRRDASRRLEPTTTEENEPDVVVIRFLTVNNILPPITTDRDILWVQCKPPDEDVAHKWKDVMKEAVKSLNAAHPNRRVFLILTTGLKWLPFLWDPPNQAQGMAQLTPNAPRLVFRKQNGQLPQTPSERDWLCDDRVVQIPPNLLPPQYQQPHIETQVVPNNQLAAGRLPIDTKQGYSIKYWDDAGNMANQQQLQFLEDLLVAIRAHRFNDQNPPDF